MKSVFVFFSLFICVIHLQGQVRLLDSANNELTQNELAERIGVLDVLFFAETHDDVLDHTMELEVLNYVDSLTKGDMTLGLEMFETDQQLVLDEYLSGLITEKYFNSQCIFWSNYSSDYHPLVNYAKDNSLEVIATNTPTRYAKMVYYCGDECLKKTSKEAKQYLQCLKSLILH